MKTKQIKFRDVPIGAMFQFPYYAESSKFRGTYKKISARFFTDGVQKFKCAASANIAKIEK